MSFLRRVALVGIAVLVATALASPAYASYKAKLTGGVLSFTGNGASDKLVLRLNGGSPCRLQGDVGGDGSAEFQFRCPSVSQLVVNAGGGSDTVLVSEAHGVFTNAVVTTLRGGPGKDKIVGGGGGETIVGGAGPDTLVGKDGSDTFLWKAGEGKDAVDGQNGTDSLALTGNASGNEFFLSREGDNLRVKVGAAAYSVEAVESVSAIVTTDGSAVFMSDLSGTDVDNVLLNMNPSFGTDLLIDGSTGSDVVGVSAVSSEVHVQGLAAALVITSSTVADNLVISGLGGSDTISGGVGLAALINLRLDGGDDSDTLNGGNGADFLNGGAGADVLDGNGGNDALFLGEGDDEARWDPGDASDVVEGQAGTDTFVFNGSAGAETFTASPNGGRLLLTRNIGGIVMDVDDVESVHLAALGGSDTVMLNDLGPTDVTSFAVDLSVGGLGDGAADSVTVAGTTGVDLFSVSGGSGSVLLQNVAFGVQVVGAESANDTLTVNLGNGDDILSAASLAGTSVALTVNGGNGNDIIVGSQGPDTLNGDANTDYIDGGAGIDSSTGGETVVNVP